MSSKARKWAAAAALLLLVAGGALTYGQVSGTFAIFTAETENQNVNANGSWIPAPSGTSSGYGGSPYITETLNWTSGHSAGAPSPNPVTGQTVLYADGGTGTSASCPAIGSYTSFKTETAIATSDPGITGTNQDDWWCFAVYSTSAQASTSGSWTSDSVTFTARRIFRASSLRATNGTNGTGTLGTGDHIIIGFNQNATLGGTIRVRVCNTQDTVLVSTNTIGSCTATVTIGTLSGKTQSASFSCNTSTVSGSGSATLTISLAGCTSTSTVGTAGSESFTPAETGEAITSSSGATLCTNTGTPDCTPTAPSTDRF